MSKVFIIAEAGVNHNGDINLAKKMIDKAVEAGVDAVKFQTFKAEKLLCKNSPKAEYQIKNTENDESQFSDRKAVFNVEGMLAYGDEANITYEITNESKYHSALLQATSTVINNNPAHFAVERSIVNSNNQIVSKITPIKKKGVPVA